MDCYLLNSLRLVIQFYWKCKIELKISFEVIQHCILLTISSQPVIPAFLTAMPWMSNTYKEMKENYYWKCSWLYRKRWKIARKMQRNQLKMEKTVKNRKKLRWITANNNDNFAKTETPIVKIVVIACILLHSVTFNVLMIHRS